MKIGLIGVGTVGGTLKQYLESLNIHDIRCYDPHKNMNDDLTGCEAIFISIPVKSNHLGQNTTELATMVKTAKIFCSEIYIRSTVLPGTNDALGTISCPEFLTERRAYEDMKSLPIVVGDTATKIDKIFPNKVIVKVRNKEAELGKFAHNCFGAMKVTYFNMIERLCRLYGLDYNDVRSIVFLTGFIEPEHTTVPGPDGKHGWGGKCFPDNVDAFKSFLQRHNDTATQLAGSLLGSIATLNYFHRSATVKVEQEINA